LDDEPGRGFWPSNDLDRPAEVAADRLRERPTVGSIDPRVTDRRHLLLCPLGDPDAGCAIRLAGGGNLKSDQPASGVDGDMPLAPIYLLAAVVAAQPPFSVVLTD
jgi:hypothetical protein